MLKNECDSAGVRWCVPCEVQEIHYPHPQAEACQGERDFAAIRYTLFTSAWPFNAQSLVIATGGLSIPKIGATPLVIKSPNSSVFRYSIKARVGTAQFSPGRVGSLFRIGRYFYRCCGELPEAIIPRKFAFHPSRVERPGHFTNILILGAWKSALHQSVARP